MQRDQFPLLLREAVISLYPADATGNPITTAPVWCGTVANGLKLGLTWMESLSFSSGDYYKTAHHDDEAHVIDIERTWIIRSATPGEAVGPQRNGRYVLEIVWNDVRERIWYKRLYYGVTARSSDLNSDGARAHSNPQSFRAQYFVASGGEGVVDVFTPIVPAVNEQLVGFFGEDPMLTGVYLLGHYRWATAKRITGARWACWSPEVETVLGLEIGGALTGDTLTLPAGVANTDATGSSTFSRAVPAASEVRWKVLSGPDIEAAVWHLGVVLSVGDA
jgi:hypothetical protein